VKAPKIEKRTAILANMQSVLNIKNAG